MHASLSLSPSMRATSAAEGMAKLQENISLVGKRGQGLCGITAMRFLGAECLLPREFRVAPDVAAWTANKMLTN